MNWEDEILRFIKENNRSILFLISIEKGFDKLASFFKKNFSGVNNFLVICFNTEIPDELKTLKLNIKSSEDYLAINDYKNIDDYVFYDASVSWYKYQNITDYRGYPLGRMFEYEFRKYLMPRVKNLEVIKNITNSVKVAAIVAINDNGSLIDASGLYAEFINLPFLAVLFNDKYEKKFFAKPLAKVKSRVSGMLNVLLDRFSFTRVIKNSGKKNTVIIDAKSYYFFKGANAGIDFLPCPIEQGLGVRLRLLREKTAYLPLHFKKRLRYHKDWSAYRRKWGGLVRDSNFRNIFCYKGIPFWRMVENRLSDFFLEGIPRVISNINMLNTLVNACNIKNAVVRNDLKELERTIIFALHLAKIPSLHLQHGILAESNGDNILAVDKFAAWGQASIDWYVRFGNSPDKFVITGNPHFDILSKWKPKFSKKQLFARMGLGSSRRTILFATQQINKFSSFWVDDLFRVMAAKISNVIQDIGGQQLIIKVDPYEEITPYSDMIKRTSRDNIVCVKDIDIYTLIYFSDLVITLDSTVALEAMVFDKPVITLNLTKRNDRVPYALRNAAIGVYRTDEISHAIQSAINDTGARHKLALARKAFIYDYAYKRDELARERILELIQGMALR